MSHLIRIIVVGVASLDDQDPWTGEGDPDPVLAPAVRLAAEVGAELHVVHAFEVPAEMAMAGGPPYGAGERRRLPDQVEERLKAQLAALPGGDAVQCRAVEGPPAERLRAAAEELGADLLMVGASRRGRAWSGILGSTAAQLLTESCIPVLVIHRPFNGAVRRVLLAADLTAPGADALRRALDMVGALCGHHALELRCLHVVESDALLQQLPVPALAAAGGERLARFLEDIRLRERPLERRVRVGGPAREIAYEAAQWSADLLVVTTHAHPDQAWRPLGGVFAAVRGAPCNVLAIPAFGSMGEGVPSLRSSPEAFEVSLAAG